MDKSPHHLYTFNMANFYNQTVKETLDELSVDPKDGLSAAEVARREARYGKNFLRVKETPLWRKLLEPFLDIFMVILIVALGLSLFQNDWIEAITIAIIIIANAVIYYIQRFSTEKILRSLKDSTRQTVLVIRDGEEQSIDSAELVPGDIVILREGDRIPADGRILNESGLLTDESMLTGESESIAKDAKAISGIKKVYEQRNMVFSGAFVYTGSGKFVVTATGNNTEYGRIASLASAAQGESSPISEKINKLVIKIAIVVVAVAILTLIIQLIDGINLLDALKFTLAMIVSAVPEGLPIAISIILALCAKRMARKQALIKELKAIESLGIVTTIASDKTGTLTENRLTLHETWVLSPANEFKYNLMRAVLLESTLINNAAGSPMADPLDICILKYLSAQKISLAKLEPLKSYAFDQKLKLSGNLYRDQSGELKLFLKGAPEVILNRSRLTTAEREKAECKLNDLANRGYKVVAIANAKIKREINELGRLEKTDQFDFAGFVAIADTIRPGAARAIRQNRRMGINTKMITGDHAGTAYAIGKQLGLSEDISEVLDCSKLGNINDDDLADLVRHTTVFARVTPEDKFRILEAIKHNEICAMTGDGVNDVPALVSSHVGIAMGDSSPIVQDAGDIVLLDNNFKNITEAIEESRTVLANIRRMLGYLLATNAGEALTMVGALIFFGDQMLTPIQILWINLVTDSLMVIPIGLEPPEAGILRQKPEPKDAPILPWYLIVRMVIIALIMSTITLSTYFIAKLALGSTAQANTLAFTSLVVMQWSSALSARGTFESAWQRLKIRHRGFHLAMLGAVLLQVAALFSPLSVFVDTVSVPWIALLIVALVSFILPLIIIELYKKLINSRVAP